MLFFAMFRTSYDFARSHLAKQTRNSDEEFSAMFIFLTALNWLILTVMSCSGLLKPLMLKLYVTKRVENFNLPRNAKPNMDLEDINRELGYISPDPKCERPRKDVYQHS